MKKKNNSGISAVPLIIALVLMITVGGFFISLMLGKHVGAPLLAQTTKALYISDAGVEYTAEYLRCYGADWTTVSDIPSTSFGDGTFAVAFPTKAWNSVTAESTGTIGNAKRIISINFTRLGVQGVQCVQSALSLNPVNYLDEYEPYGTPGPTILCEGGTPCGPPPNTCLCTYQPTTQEVPILTPPTGVTWLDLDISGNYTFAAGTYYFNDLNLKKIGGNDAHVTVSGPVTIWIQHKFVMDQDTTFNYLPPYGDTDYGDPANVLLIAASTEEEEAEFELKERAKFSGAIYAPNGEVELKESAQVVGAIVGNEVELKNRSSVTFDSGAGSNTTGYLQTFGVKASGWGEI